MERHPLTTSFGRRAATLGQVAAQLQVSRALETPALPGSNAPAAVHKWALFRMLTEIREQLGVSDRSLSVLNALLSFHPETALTLPKSRMAKSSVATPRAAGADDDADGDVERENSSDESALPCDLVVFPSNKALAARAHGMASMTLWRHLKALTDAGLIIRRDSPNGKRYARKDATGQERFSHAYGFDLTPLVVRATEFEALAEEGRAAQRSRYLTKERISLLRRDVSKLIGLGLDEGLPGDWEAMGARAMALMTPLRRIREDCDLAALEAALASLRAEITRLLDKALESQLNAQDSMSNDHHNDKHLSNSKTQCHNDLEPTSKEDGSKVDDPPETVHPDSDAAQHKIESVYPLGMVREACPDLKDYAPAGRIKTWSDLLAAAAAIRPMIGISPDAWRDAQEALGAVEAHVAVAVILQRSIHSSEAATTPEGRGGEGITVNGSPAIRSAGGYLRVLTEQAKAGTFSLGPILMATIGQRLKARRSGLSAKGQGRVSDQGSQRASWSSVPAS